MACDAPSSLGIYVITVNTVSPNNTWVYDTGCGSYIWIDMQGLRNRRKLTKGESDFQVGNGARVATAALWTYVLNLPSDLYFNLEDCYYVPALTKNIISISCLNKNDFIYILKQWLLHYDVFYAGGTLSNGIYILDISNPIIKVNDNQKTKIDNLKSSYSWHCRLGHASERRMTELHNCGSLRSFDCESFEKSESYLLGNYD